MSEIARQLLGIQDGIRAACLRSGRDISELSLIAVSKTFPAEAILEAVDAGHTCFAESRLQEAEPKIATLPAGLDWHFIGAIQRNKVRRILPLFGCLHAIDSLRLATYTDAVSGDLKIRPKIFLQVNLAGEQSKGGFSEKELRSSIGEIAALENIEAVGLMTIPPAEDGAEASRKWFRALKHLRDSIAGDFPISLPFLSMGMSGDFEIAIEEGATHVRVGSAIFGKRFQHSETLL